jgi:hypothetical protein
MACVHKQRIKQAEQNLSNQELVETTSALGIVFVAFW